jgi:hypothetical protein
MPTNFPTTLDSFTDPAGTDTLGGSAVVHHLQHANANDAIAALEAKVGINSSAVTTSLDYLVNHVTSAMLAGSIASSKLVGSDISTVGTLTAGVWNATPLTAAYLPTLDAITAPAGNISLNSHKLTNVLDPTSAQDAATKNYVDAATIGLDVKASVRAATTANITLSGTQTVDGVALNIGDRVLVKAQTSGSANGIYVVASGAWTRSADTAISADVSSGMFTFATEGTINAGTGWILTTADPITLGTTALTYTQFSGAGTYTAGAGLTLTGTQFLISPNAITYSLMQQVAASSLVGNPTGSLANAQGITLGTNLSFSGSVLNAAGGSYTASAGVVLTSSNFTLDVTYAPTWTGFHTFNGGAKINSYYGTITADADGATITFDASVSNRHLVTLGGNRTLAVANDNNGQTFLIILTQDGTGSRTVTWWSGITWPGGVAPTLSTTAGATDIFTITRLSSGVYRGFSSTILGTPVGTTLNSANLWLGSAGNVAAAVAVTGNVTISNTGVTTIGAGQVTNAMLASFRGDQRLTADAPNATTTLSSGVLTDLTVSSLLSGHKYTGRLVIKCNNSAAAEGIQIDFNGGSATFSSFWAGAGVLASGGTDVIGTNIATSLSGAISFSTITGETVIIVEFSGVCNGNGTFIPRFAEAVTHVTGTATVELGSNISVKETAN